MKKAKNQNTRLKIENNDLGRQVALKNRMLKENQKRIDELEDKETKLGYFRKYLRKEDYEKLIKIGKDDEKTRHRQR